MAGSSSLSVGELTILLYTVALTLIPLMIWVVWDFDNRKHGDRNSRASWRFFKQKP
jgi:hypothetical protein